MRQPRKSNRYPPWSAFNNPNSYFYFGRLPDASIGQSIADWLFCLIWLTFSPTLFISIRLPLLLLAFAYANFAAKPPEFLVTLLRAVAAAIR